ncbi:13022_t:CDS:2 [Funneliformis geosporum]|nr:13022_t:CDS:2 [Funneliformis geosporum]
MKGIETVKQDTLREAKNKEWDFNEFIIIGRKELHRVSDFMKYADIAKEQNMKIDINYYLEIIIAICVCFINEDDMYQPLASDRIMQIKNSDKREKYIDIYFYKKAKNDLEKNIKSLQ